MNNKKYTRIENHVGYSRDLRSNAIVSDDRSSYDLFLRKKQEKRNMTERLDNVEKTLDAILKKIEEIDGVKK